LVTKLLRFLFQRLCRSLVEDLSILVKITDFSLFLLIANQKGLKIKKSLEPNSDRRMTRSKGKQEIEPPLEEAIKKACGHSFLSPLAARAALASVICTLPLDALSKQPEKFPVSPEISEEVVGFPLVSPLATRTNLTSFASVLPANGLPKQAEKPPLMPNQLGLNSDAGGRISVNPGCEKVDPAIPRRITRSATKREGADLMTDMKRTRGQKSMETEKGNREARISSFTPDVEDIVTPVKTEKNGKSILPFASAATTASIVSNTISDCEGESYNFT
jgi:hypothetical protein